MLCLVLVWGSDWVKCLTGGEGTMPYVLQEIFYDKNTNLPSFLLWIFLTFYLPRYCIWSFLTDIFWGKNSKWGCTEVLCKCERNLFKYMRRPQMYWMQQWLWPYITNVVRAINSNILTLFSFISILVYNYLKDVFFLFVSSLKGGVSSSAHQGSTFSVINNKNL